MYIAPVTPGSAEDAGRARWFRRREPLIGIVGVLVLAAVCWIGYRAVGASLVPGDGDPHPAGVGCVTWKGPLMVIDGPVLSNRTGHTVHVSDVDVPDAEGIRLHEIRTVSTSSDVVFGAAYDPADPG